jgi:hypothetical protein
MSERTNEIATKTEQIELTSPSDIMNFATNLKELIVQNKLFTQIKGKNYVNVEGWQIAGAFTGTFPIVENVENLSEGNSYKYRAEVSLRDKDNNKVGYGVAICTNKEPGKTNFDEYAVASMAQTRAVGKAYRMKIGWLLKVAGYETTPAEEMDAVAAEVVEESVPKKIDFKEVRERLTEIDDINDLNDYWKSLHLTEAQAKVLQPDFTNRKLSIQFN